jgi:hypothetical protein
LPAAAHGGLVNAYFGLTVNYYLELDARWLAMA